MVAVQTVENKDARTHVRSRSRIVALVLALAAAAAFALSMQAAWWTAGEVSIGPFGARHCFGGECRETGLSWIGGTDLWMRAGVAARAGGYIAMFVLVIVAGALAARRVPRLMAKAAIVSILTATATGVYFAAAFPGLGGSSVGHGIILFAAAIGLGMASAVATLRLNDPSSEPRAPR
jgi:hypothetical protein